MTKSPYINASAAALYISAVVLLISSFEHFDGPETLVIPMAMISLLVLSVLAMGFIFFFQPVQMYLDGDKKGAAQLFIKEAATFAVITIALLGVLIYSMQ